MAFERDTKIKDSIITSEIKSKKEEQAEKEKFTVNSDLPVNKNNRAKDKKVYRTYYLYESQIKKLEKIAKRNGYVKKNGDPNASAFIRDWIDSI